MARTLITVIAHPLGEHDDPEEMAGRFIDATKYADVPNKALGMASYAVAEGDVKPCLYEAVRVFAET